MQFDVERSSFRNCSFSLEDLPPFAKFVGAVLQLHPLIVAASCGLKCTPENSNTNVRQSREFPGIRSSEWISYGFDEKRALSFAPLRCSPTSPSHAAQGTQPWPCSPRRELVGHPGVLSTSQVPVSAAASGCFAVGASCDGHTPAAPDAGSFSCRRSGVKKSTSMRTSEHLLLMPTGPGGPSTKPKALGPPWDHLLKTKVIKLHCQQGVEEGNHLGCKEACEQVRPPNMYPLPHSPMHPMKLCQILLKITPSPAATTCLIATVPLVTSSIPLHARSPFQPQALSDLCCHPHQAQSWPAQ